MFSAAILFACLFSANSRAEIPPIPTAPAQAEIVAVSSPTLAQIDSTDFKQVFWVNEDSDTLSGFVSSSSGVITATAAGTYKVLCQIAVFSGGTELAVAVRLNESTAGDEEGVENSCDPVSGSISVCQASTVLRVGANDRFSCWGYHSAAQYLRTDKRRSFFKAIRLSP